MHRPDGESNRGGTTSPEANPPPDARPEAVRPSGKPAGRGLTFTLAALGLAVVSAVAGTGLARWLQDRPQAPKPDTPKPTAPPGALPARLFQGWPKPDLVILLSAQQHGYLLPCGCSEPQTGGLERRYNLLQLLKQRGWPVAAVDLGDIPQRKGPANLPNRQGMIKYKYSMKALKEMGYTAVGLGENEAALSLFSIMGEWALNEEKPAVVTANLKGVFTPEDQAGAFFAFRSLMVADTPVRVGVTAAVGQTLQDKIKDPALHFLSTSASLQKALEQMRKDKVELPILLYHGLSTAGPGQRPEAIACAEALPELPIVLCLSEEDEPPGSPVMVDHPKLGIKNYVFRMGHKGKYVGVLGVYRNQPGQAFSFRYQLVELTPEYATPREKQPTHPIMKLMEEYTRELRDKDYLGQYKQSRHLLQAMEPVAGLRNSGTGVPTYIGTEKCARCHEPAYEVWKKTPHSHAYQALVEAKHPSLRQFDAECIVCHTVGFAYQGGFTSADKTPHLKNVGCESCHGPGSLHAANPNDEEWKARMNQPWRAAKARKDRDLAIDKFCQSCHDIDNDVTWIHGAFEKKWKTIAHPNP